MTARHQRRIRRAHAVNTERDTLVRIHEQLNRLQAPADPGVLSAIDIKLERIESSLGDIRSEAKRIGANAGFLAGGLSGGIVTLAIMLIKAKLEF
ncbi:hypothetical protein [Pantoea stewartii]|uniref:hypothetical protein n=1 Tax=Pantoea stewartii TaxID=66269 RepID=UPI003368558D